MEYKIDSEKPSYQEFDQERQFEERGEREKKKTFKFSEHYFERDSVSVCVRFNWLSSEQMTLVSLKIEKETIIKRVWTLEQVTFLLSKLTLREGFFWPTPISALWMFDYSNLEMLLSFVQS